MSVEPATERRSPSKSKSPLSGWVAPLPIVAVEIRGLPVGRVREPRGAVRARGEDTAHADGEAPYWAAPRPPAARNAQRANLTTTDAARSLHEPAHRRCRRDGRAARPRLLPAPAPPG